MATPATVQAPTRIPEKLAGWTLQRLPELAAEEHVGKLLADYIDGLDLARLRRRGPVPAAAAIQIGLQVSAALAYAHAEGVIHRDIKPSNLMLVRHPGGDVFAKVIDFGIAKLARGSDLADSAPAGARRETRGDIVAGTTPYWNGHEGPSATSTRSRSRWRSC